VATSSTWTQPQRVPGAGIHGATSLSSHSSPLRYFRAAPLCQMPGFGQIDLALFRRTEATV